MVNGTDRPQVRVLMVDDDLVDRRAVRRALGEGFVVTEAEDGSQARQSFDSAVPDCVLLDYNIPGTNTLELLDRFRQHAPVVMLTGQDDVEAAVAAMKAGAQDYLCKNEFSAERLNQAIHRSIDKAGRQRRELEARGRLRNEYRSEKRRRRQLEASLQIARDIQQNLIPSRAPQVDGFDFCGVCLPIEETAGDFFDYVPMGDGSLGVILGDISGHGIGPALLTAETRAFPRPEPREFRCRPGHHDRQPVVMGRCHRGSVRDPLFRTARSDVAVADVRLGGTSGVSGSPLGPDHRAGQPDSPPGDVRGSRHSHERTCLSRGR